MIFLCVLFFFVVSRRRFVGVYRRVVFFVFCVMFCKLFGYGCVSLMMSVFNVFLDLCVYSLMDVIDRIKMVCCDGMCVVELLCLYL